MLSLALAWRRCSSWPACRRGRMRFRCRTPERWTASSHKQLAAELAQSPAGTQSIARLENLVNGEIHAGTDSHPAGLA